jgi:hypothetical protein
MDIAGGAGASPAGSEASSDPIDARPGARRCVSSSSECFRPGAFGKIKPNQFRLHLPLVVNYLASTLSRMATNRFFSFVMNEGA